MNNAVSLQELFTNRLFRVPDYQRGYAWSERKFVEELAQELGDGSADLGKEPGLTVATVAAPASAAKPKCDGKVSTIFSYSKVIRGTSRADVIVAKGNKNNRLFGKGGRDEPCRPRKTPKEMSMHKITAALAATVFAVATAAPAAFAAELPDMLGTWVGTSRAVVAGSGGHYVEGVELAAFREVDLTVEWTAQDDGRLIGSLSSARHTEPKIAVLSADGQTLVAADLEGTSVGRLIDDDHFELCYTQSSIADTQLVASCVVFARVVE